MTSDAELQKDQQGNFSLVNRQQQSELTFLQNEQVQSILTKIDRSFDNSDDPRWKVIPQVDQYKDQSLFLSNESASFSLDKTYRTNENFSRLQNTNSNTNLLREEKIAQNHSSAVDYFDEKLILDMDLMQRSVSVTYDNSLSKDDLQ